MRERILAEIKRIAEANGGVTPGLANFNKETGYRTSDWLGKYWARWGDAVAEAGLVVQVFKQKQDTTLFYPKLAEAIRYYKKVPTKPELKLYRRLNPDFPWPNTLETHFESKSKMYELVKAWATENAGYSDVVALIPEISLTQKDPKKADSEGHVYLIKSGAFYKIGRGDELEKRVKQIRTALPDASSLEHSIRTDDPSGIEAYWHRRFADKRANGEWFKLTASDVAAFRKRKYQ
jgi:hypothetical protein